MPDVIMPRLSDSMQEGTIIRWLKANGDHVRRDEELLEIETDKATMIYESDADGVLSIAVPEGETVVVGEVIGRLGDGSAIPVDVATAGTARNGGGTATRPAVGALPSVSPVARRTARRLGIDLGEIIGSGPRGRILKADVAAAGRGAPAPDVAPAATETGTAPAPPAEASQPTAGTEPVAAADRAGARDDASSRDLTRTQALIARRMVESRATVPDFALEVDVDMGAALELRDQLKQLADTAPSVNDIVVKACALALRRHPRANGSYRDGRFELHAHVNVGIAVAAQDALLVPTVRDADAKSLGAIAAETARLALRVRERQISPAELAGATFTVSNLGMYGIDRFEGIIDAPQAAILCVGAIRACPVARGQRVEVRPMMTATLACDHRILYGADAAAFLAEIRRLLEAPLTMAL